jgi:hypothetical protein
MNFLKSQFAFLFVFLAFSCAWAVEKNQSAMSSNTINQITSSGDTLWVLHDKGISFMPRELNSWTNYAYTDFSRTTIAVLDILTYGDRVFTTGGYYTHTDGFHNGFILEFNKALEKWETQTFTWQGDFSTSSFGHDLAVFPGTGDTSLFCAFESGNLLQRGWNDTSSFILALDTSISTGPPDSVKTNEYQILASPPPYKKIATVASDTFRDTLWFFAGSHAGLYRICETCSTWERITTDTVYDTVDTVIDTIGLGDTWGNPNFREPKAYTERYIMRLKIQDISDTSGKKLLWGYAYRSDSIKALTKKLQNYTGLIRSGNAGKNWERVRLFTVKGDTVVDTLLNSVNAQVAGMDFWKDTAFISTDRGVYIVANDTVQLRLTKNNGLPSDQTTCIHVRPDRLDTSRYELWIGTFKHGLVRYTPGRTNKWTYVVQRREDLLGDLEEVITVPTALSLDAEPSIIGYGISKDAKVTIDVYDFAMKKVKNIITNQLRRRGRRSEDRRFDRWDGTDQNGRRVSVGVYYIRVRTDTGHMGWTKMIVRR